MISNSIGTILGTLLARLPVLIIWGVGLFIAISRWSRHPRKSLFIVIALTVLFFQSMVGAVLNAALPMWLYNRGMEGARMGLIFGLRNFGGAIISAIAWGFLIAALFMPEEPASA